MIADINDGNPQSVQYIHWRNTEGSFHVGQILCYEKKRMYDSDMAGSYWYILEQNGGIEEPWECDSTWHSQTYVHYNGYHTIWRAIIISGNAISDTGNTIFTNFQMDLDDGAETKTCDFDFGENGYDCYTETINNNYFPHNKMVINVASTDYTCMIILLEGTDDQTTQQYVDGQATEIQEASQITKINTEAEGTWILPTLVDFEIVFDDFDNHFIYTVEDETTTLASTEYDTKFFVLPSTYPIVSGSLDENVNIHEIQVNNYGFEVYFSNVQELDLDSSSFTWAGSFEVNTERTGFNINAKNFASWIEGGASTLFSGDFTFTFFMQVEKIDDDDNPIFSQYGAKYWVISFSHICYLQANVALGVEFAMGELDVSGYSFSNPSGIILADYEEDRHYTYTVSVDESYDYYGLTWSLSYTLDEYPGEAGKFYLTYQSDGTANTSNSDGDITSPCGIPYFTFLDGEFDEDTGESSYEWDTSDEINVILADSQKPFAEISIQTFSSAADFVMRNQIQVSAIFTLNNQYMAEKQDSEFLLFSGSQDFQIYVDSCAEVEYMYPYQILFYANDASNDEFKTYLEGGTSEQFTKMTFDAYRWISFESDFECSITPNQDIPTEYFAFELQNFFVKVTNERCFDAMQTHIQQITNLEIQYCNTDGNCGTVDDTALDSIWVNESTALDSSSQHAGMMDMQQMLSGKSYSFIFTSHIVDFYNNGTTYLDTSVEYKFNYKGSICDLPDEFEIICSNRLGDAGIPNYSSDASFLGTYQIPCNQPQIFTFEENQESDQRFYLSGLQGLFNIYIKKWNAFDNPGGPGYVNVDADCGAIKVIESSVLYSHGEDESKLQLVYDKDQPISENYIECPEWSVQAAGQTYRIEFIIQIPIVGHKESVQYQCVYKCNDFSSLEDWQDYANGDFALQIPLLIGDSEQIETIEVNQNLYSAGCEPDGKKNVQLIEAELILGDNFNNTSQWLTVDQLEDIGFEFLYATGEILTSLQIGAISNQTLDQATLNMVFERSVTSQQTGSEATIYKSNTNVSVTFENISCSLSPKDVVSSLGNTDLTLILTQDSQDESNKSYEDFKDLAEQVFGLDKEWPPLCGDLNITIENPYTFLTIDEDQYRVLLNPTSEDQNGLYDDAYITFSMSLNPEELLFTVQVEAEIEKCKDMLNQIPDTMKVDLDIDNQLTTGVHIPPFDSISQQILEECSSEFELVFSEVSYSNSNSSVCDCSIYQHPQEALIEVSALLSSPETYASTVFQITYKDETKQTEIDITIFDSSIQDITASVEQDGDSQGSYTDEIFTWNYNRTETIEDYETFNITKYKISHGGLLHIGFSKPIMIPPIRQKKELRGLEDQGFYNISEVIDLRVKAGEENLDRPIEDFLIATYDLVNVTEEYLEIQIEFLKPNSISENMMQPELLEISLNLEWLFVDLEGLQRLQENLKIELPLPEQLVCEDYEVIKDFGEKAEADIQAFSLLTFVICLVLGYGLKFFWNIINVLQFFIFMQRWQVILPILTNELMSSVKMLVLFEFLPTEEIIKWIQSKAGQNQDQVDLLHIEDGSVNESEHMLKNGGTILILGAFVFVLIVLIAILSTCDLILYSHYKIFKFYMELKQKLFFNSIIRYFLTSCIKLQYLAMDIFIAGFAFTYTGTAKFAYAILIFLMMYGLYIYLFLYMRKHRDILHKPSTQAKIGNLYAGLRIETVDRNPFAVEYYSFFFYLRRAIFIVISFSLYPYPGLQVMAFLQLSIFYLIYIGSVDYFKKKKKKAIEIANECIGIVMIYCYLMLVNIVSEHQLRKWIGLSIIGAIAAVLILNFFLMALKIAKVSRRKCRGCRQKQKFKQHKKKLAILKQKTIQWEIAEEQRKFEQKQVQRQLQFFIDACNDGPQQDEEAGQLEAQLKQAKLIDDTRISDNSVAQDVSEYQDSQDSQGSSELSEIEIEEENINQGPQQQRTKKKTRRYNRKKRKLKGNKKTQLNKSENVIQVQDQQRQKNLRNQILIKELWTEANQGNQQAKMRYQYLMEGNF